jgi:hypothetical protein
MKNNKYYFLALIIFLVSCENQISYSGTSSRYHNGVSLGRTPEALHKKFCQENAQKNIMRGMDNALTISKKFGKATSAKKLTTGETVWTYQIRTETISLDPLSPAELLAKSTGTLATKSINKTTTLQIKFDAHGSVKDFFARQEIL